MICNSCSGEMNPINLEETIFECTKCNHRQHKQIPDLDLSGFKARSTHGEIINSDYFELQNTIVQ